MNAMGQLPRSRIRSLSPSSRTVTIGLLNNMPDEALEKTERQFAGLVHAGADDLEINLRLFALGRTPRSPNAFAYLSARCEPASAMFGCKLDGLIVTGAQPRAARLSDEPYWRELTEILDWAKENTASTILSCLAAHAGVWHLDRIERRRLAEKRSGLFTFAAQREHPLLGERRRCRLTPHSRYNGLSQSELEAAGYEILTSSPAHGVDSFVKSFGSQFVFLQGHPEYDANSLAREYRRDMGRYLRRETDALPAMPKGYFAAEAETQLRELERRAREDSGGVSVEDLAKIDALAPARAVWRDAAVSFYRNWIDLIGASARLEAADVALLATEPRRTRVEAYQEL